ncbi:MAG TPA: ABC transporter permease [Methylomirabilota bacterium]|jgi:peptide/nickel transport system permease protein|nr:ABC transporter permease [Methylomirabilota bacterium]
MVPTARPPRRSRRRPLDLWVGVLALAWVALLVGVGSVAWPLDTVEIRLDRTFRPPGSAGAAGGAVHPLGTDQLGRDLLARLIRGTKISVGIVLAAGLVSAVLGTGLGLASGFAGRAIDAAVMRMVDVQIAIPFVLLILLVVAVVGASTGSLIAVLGVTGWAIYARVARAQVLVVRELEYVQAARALGLGDGRILWRHILPNILSTQIVLLTVDLPRFVLLESAVGFLGLGVQPPTPTLGNLIGEGRSYMLLAWWLVVFPGVVIALLVVGFNLVGDWLARRGNVRVD